MQLPAALSLTMLPPGWCMPSAAVSCEPNSRQQPLQGTQGGWPRPCHWRAGPHLCPCGHAVEHGGLLAGRLAAHAGVDREAALPADNVLATHLLYLVLLAARQGTQDRQRQAGMSEGTSSNSSAATPGHTDAGAALEPAGGLLLAAPRRGASWAAGLFKQPSYCTGECRCMRCPAVDDGVYDGGSQACCCRAHPQARLTSWCHTA